MSDHIITDEIAASLKPYVYAFFDPRDGKPDFGFHDFGSPGFQGSVK
jgi:hypothetical protein